MSTERVKAFGIIEALASITLIAGVWCLYVTPLQGILL
jgi:hypothetical protein